MSRKPRKPLDPLAALTAKPAPITKAESAAAYHAKQAFERQAAYGAFRAYQDDPQRDRTGPQIRIRGSRYRYVAHGNPNDLYGRW